MGIDHNRGTFTEATMISPDGDLKEFPVWAWPYINVAKLARETVKQRNGAPWGRVPEAAVDAHVHAIFSAIAFQRVVSHIEDHKLQEPLQRAAAAALSRAIDDCGNDKPKPWPHPPRAVELMEVAGALAVAAASVKDEAMSNGLAQAATRLGDLAAKG